MVTMLGDIEGWNGAWVGGMFQEGGDVCICVADSLHCAAETKTIL